MHSSTSASEHSDGRPNDAAGRHRARRAISLLLSGCLLVALGVEVGARVALDRMSKIQRRTATEYRLAREIGPSPDGRGHVLVVGNSLLDEGVRFDRLREGLAARWDVRRFVVEQTAYYDWYYGLRRLFADGARPDVVVLMLTATQWTADGWRGDYSAQYLLRTRDSLDAARALQFNPTQAANLVFANISKFWGARAEIRNFVMGHLMPNLGDMMNYSSVVDATPVVDEEIRRKVRPRVETLRQLAQSYHARFVVLLAPVLTNLDGAKGLMDAAADAHVPALRPVVSGSLGPELYRDAGFHLNPAGAGRFTERLIPALRGELSRLSLRADAGGDRSTYATPRVE